MLEEVAPLPSCSKSKADFLPLDLADPATIHRFVNSFEARNLPLDILICNAGIMAPPARCLAKNGLELQFQVSPYQGTAAASEGLWSLGLCKLEELPSLVLANNWVLRDGVRLTTTPDSKEYHAPDSLDGVTNQPACRYR